MPLPPPEHAPGHEVLEMELVMAEGWLEAGRYRSAIEAFRALEQKHPDDPRIARGLGRALAGAGWCREALYWLDLAREGGRFSATEAWYEGSCRESMGDLAGARVAFEEGVRLDAGHARAWASLARLGDRTGEVGLAEAARERLWTLPEGWLLVWLCDARREVLLGSPEADRELAALAPLRVADASIRREWHLLDGLLALQEGDPVYAAETLAEAVRADPRDAEAAAWHAEALRRAGEPEEALAVLQRPWLALRDPTVELLAVAAALEARAP